MGVKGTYKNGKEYIGKERERGGRAFRSIKEDKQTRLTVKRLRAVQ